MNLRNNNKIFYIYCPSNRFSGGPTALHQLAGMLRDKKHNVFMHYIRHLANPVHPNYAHYKIPFTENIPDESNVHIILPETYTFPLFKFKKANIIIWWLSVDNYHKITNYHKQKEQNAGKSIREKIMSYIVSFRSNKIYYDINNKTHRKIKITHLAQSYYAYDFLTKNGLSPKYLHCYLGDEFENPSYAIEEKSDIVLYNPLKGGEFTSKLIEYCPGISFLKLQDMSPEEVMEKMKQAKIYIDFGSHPGRDRFPREAAFCGCCIITGNKGSAENDFDIMIPSKYKFKQNSCDLKDIKKMIQEIFDNFIDHYPKFETYRNIISNEKKTFEHELDEVINEVQ